MVYGGEIGHYMIRYYSKLKLSDNGFQESKT